MQIDALIAECRARADGLLMLEGAIAAERVHPLLPEADRQKLVVARAEIMKARVRK